MTATYDAMIRVRVPSDVRDRLNAEALALGKPLAAHVRDLIVARDNKKHGAKPVAPEKGK